MKHSFLVSLSLLVIAYSIGALPKDATPVPGDKPVTAASQRFVDKHVLPGVVTLVADKDKVLSSETIGLADIARNKPMSTDSVF